jgi:hypothetical protein
MQEGLRRICVKVSNGKVPRMKFIKLSSDEMWLRESFKILFEFREVSRCFKRLKSKVEGFILFHKSS